jgi:transcriptional regulator with XRE-family HTH domain
MTTLPTAGTNRGHGSTAWALGKRCPCRKCKAAKNAYQRQVYRLRGYGQWQPYVDVGPTIKHVETLRNAGISIMQIAEQSGLHNNHIRRIASGKTKQVRPETEAAILGLTVEGMRRKLLPSTGSARRLQALLAVGWPLVHVAPYIGMNPVGVDRILHQSFVLPATADAIASVYEQLKDQKPEDHGISLMGAQKSRRLAERRGWRDPVWWEDMGHIDDPEFDPATADRPLDFFEQAELRAEEILHLASYGLAPEEIADRLGMSAQYVTSRLRELRAGQGQNKGAAA